MSVLSDQPAAAHRAPMSQEKLRTGIMIYLAILATVFVVASLLLSASANSAVSKNDRRIEQLQIDTNDNLCNQSAYQGGTQCVGGDSNGGSLGGL